MRKLIVAAGLAFAAIPTAAQADHRHELRDLRQIERQCQRELRRADTRREYVFIVRECRREIAQARREYFIAERRHFRRFDDRRDWDRRWDRRRDRDDDDDDD